MWRSELQRGPVFVPVNRILFFLSAGITVRIFISVWSLRTTCLDGTVLLGIFNCNNFLCAEMYLWPTAFSASCPTTSLSLNYLLKLTGAHGNRLPDVFFSSKYARGICKVNCLKVIIFLVNMGCNSGGIYIQLFQYWDSKGSTLWRCQMMC